MAIMVEPEVGVKKPPDLKTVDLKTRTKAAANTANAFTNSQAISSVTNVQVATVEPASGGAEAESISSIKLNAPLDYATQGRAVTADDFKVYTKKLFANTQAVSVWGGEDGSFDVATGLTSSQPEY